jgi:hypothetical protein
MSFSSLVRGAADALQRAQGGGGDRAEPEADGARRDRAPAG